MFGWRLLRSFARAELNRRGFLLRRVCTGTCVLACVRTAAVFGIEACPVQVEVDVSFGLPAFTMVGLPDVSVRESRDRVRSAIRNSGLRLPRLSAITVNLAPADVRKAGSSFDLPIALGVLAATGVGRAPAQRATMSCCSVNCRSTAASTRRAACCRLRPAARRDRYSALLLPRQSRGSGGRAGPAALSGAIARPRRSMR